MTLHSHSGQNKSKEHRHPKPIAICNQSDRPLLSLSLPFSFAVNITYLFTHSDPFGIQNSKHTKTFCASFWLFDQTNRIAVYVTIYRKRKPYSFIFNTIMILCHAMFLFIHTWIFTRNMLFRDNHFTNRVAAKKNTQNGLSVHQLSMLICEIQRELV